MEIWAFILCAVLTLSLIFILSFAIVYNFQQIRCHGDKKIVCWADWICNDTPEEGQPPPPSQYSFVNYFLSYSQACLFAADPQACECNDLGYTKAKGVTFNPYADKDDTSGGKPVYNADSQNICGPDYPETLMKF